MKKIEKFSSANIDFSKRNLPLHIEIGVLTPVLLRKLSPTALR